jgi:predicted HAD superfamily phosphohydrolase YqeG
MQDCRTALWSISSLAELPRLPLDFRVVLLDLENTVLPYRATERDVAAMAEHLTILISELPSSARLVLNTNKVRCQAVVKYQLAALDLQIIEHCRKPLRRYVLRELNGADPTVVVGDQVLTDGFLARGLARPFVRVAGSSRWEPAWPRLMRRAGSAVAPVFFRSDEGRS